MNSVKRAFSTSSNFENIALKFYCNTYAVGFDVLCKMITAHKPLVADGTSEAFLSGVGA